MGFIKDTWNGITGKTAGNAAKQAGQLQADASKQAGQIAQQQYEQSRNDLMPWMNAGKNALGGLESFVAGTGNNTNAYSDMLMNGLKGLNLGGGGVGGGGVGTGSFNDKMMPTIQKNYDEGKYTGGLSQEDFQVDPSYEFRKQQGMDGIQGSAAASGSLLSGAALKSLNSHNSNLASQEYGNAWARDQAVKQQQFGVDTGLRGQNYEMYSGDANRQLQADMTSAQLSQNAQIQNQNHGLNALGLLSGISDNEYARKYNGLSGLVGMGQNAAGGLGSLGANNVAVQGNALTNAGNAQANGLIGAANAKTQGLQNLLGLGAKAFGAM